MTEIRPLTTDDLCASARAAAEQHIPHAEANHFEQGSELWRLFNEAYHGEAEAA